MIDPHSRPTGADPFAPEPRRASQGGGCGRPLLIGCGVLALLLTIALVVLFLKSPDLLAWSLERMRAAVAEATPEEVSEVEAARLDAAFEAAIRAVRDGTFRVDEMPRLQQVIMEVAGRIDRLTPADLHRLTEALEAVAGRAGEVEEEGPPAGEPRRAPRSLTAA